MKVFIRKFIRTSHSKVESIKNHKDSLNSWKKEAFEDNDCDIMIHYCSVTKEYYQTKNKIYFGKKLLARTVNSIIQEEDTALNPGDHIVRII